MREPPLLIALIVALFTSSGEIDISVDSAHAPKTAANFAGYVRRGAFTHGSFFRTVLTRPDNQPQSRVKIDVIQADVRPGYVTGAPVPFEATSVTGLRHRDGTVSMARDTRINSATASFFICIGDQPSLDDGGRRSADHRGFAAFGQVVRGMDVVRAIHRAAHDKQTLTPPIVIKRAEISAVNYSEYLHLPELLAAQQPLSGEHDELLFVIIHQTTELWMKLCIHELRAVVKQVHDDDLAPAFKMLSRIGRVQSHMTESWETLATMTPADYLKFRGTLGSSSGLQSHQYRLIDLLLGAKDAAMLEMHRNDPEQYAELEAALRAPSLYDETLRLLARRGFAIPPAALERDWSLPYVPSAEVEAAWLAIYHDIERYWDLDELAEKLVDVEYRFQKWRFAHLKTVERVIGFRRGTGGTAGAAYLAKRLEKSFFPELFSLRTEM